jgi:general secretion pathway protein D
MTAKILRKKFLVAVSVFLMFVTFPGPAGKTLRAQQPAPEETDDEADESQPEVPAPQTPQPQVAPRPPVAAPRQPPPAPGQPPVAAPERRMVPPPTATAKGDMVSLNFNRADLIEVIHVLAQHLRLTYTIDPEVKGTVTINSAEPLRREDLMPVFHQILRMNGAVAVKAGENMYRIAPIEKGKGLARPASGDQEGGYAIQIVPLRFFSVAEMKRLLTPFLTPGGEVFDFPRGNFLMIVDLPSNVERLMEIRDMIDVQTFVGTRTDIYQPKVASADELAAEMTKVMQAYASSSSQAEGFAAQFLSIPRINQLLVIADSEAAWSYIQRWLQRLDTIGEGPGRRIFIYPVENGKAADLADVLTQVLGITGAPRRERGPTLEQLHRGTPTTPTTPGSQQRTPGTGGFGGSGAMGSGGLYAAAPTPQQPPATTQPPTTTPRQPQQPARPGEARPGEKPQEEQMRVVADTNTNTLIIYGTAQEFQNIRNILKELDLTPRQVLLECLIAEVKLTGSNSLGFDYEILRGKSDKFTDAFRSGGQNLLGDAIPSFPFQFGGTLGIKALAGDSRVRTLITAFMEDKRAKILASPTILATDNQPARIQVGDEVPISTGTLQTAVGSTTDLATSNSIQFRNTGKILTIIPQVNSRGLVNLQFKVEVSKLGSDVTVGSQKFSSFETRDAETTAVVKDGETLVIGGIISEDRSHGKTGIPFLMDIPVFGWFFRNTTDTLTERTELIIVITPHVIRNEEEVRSVTEEFRRKLSTVAAEIERMRRGGAKDDLPPPKAVPDRESRTAPELAPENSATGGAGGTVPNGSGPLKPSPIGVEAEPSKSWWKFW